MKEVDLYHSGVESSIRAIVNLRTVLLVAKQWAERLGKDHSVITEHTLFPDMLPVRWHVILSCRYVIEYVWSITGNELLTIRPHDYVTLSSIMGLCDRTIDGLRTVPKSTVLNLKDGYMAIVRMDVHYDTGSSTLVNMKPGHVLNFWLLPNLNFHCTTTYCMLRNLGVPLGKYLYINSTLDDFQKENFEL